jgi:hypothetical protein
MSKKRSWNHYVKWESQEKPQVIGVKLDYDSIEIGYIKDMEWYEGTGLKFNLLHECTFGVFVKEG